MYLSEKMIKRLFYIEKLNKIDELNAYKFTKLILKLPVLEIILIVGIISYIVYEFIQPTIITHYEVNEFTGRVSMSFWKPYEILHLSYIPIAVVFILHLIFCIKHKIFFIETILSFFSLPVMLWIYEFHEGGWFQYLITILSIIFVALPLTILYSIFLVVLKIKKKREL